MTYWYCLICGSTSPAVAGQPQPSWCQGHDKSNAITPGLRWELHEKCRFCDTNFLSGADRCPKCNNPTGKSPHRSGPNSTEKTVQNSKENKDGCADGCLNVLGFGCLVEPFGCLSVVLLPVVLLAAAGVWALS